MAGDPRPSRPPVPGQPGHQDYAYIRHGSANLFLACAPQLGWRQITVTDRHTGIDWASFMRGPVDVHVPDAIRITLVLDNLNTHTPASLYKAFPPAEAKRIGDKLELHYTPNHGVWLNMADCERGAVATQCLLHRRMPDAGRRHPGPRRHGLGGGPHCPRRPDRLAVHHGRCPDSAQAALPRDYRNHQDNLALTDHSG